MKTQKKNVEIDVDRDDPPPDDFHQVNISIFDEFHQLLLF